MQAQQVKQEVHDSFYTFCLDWTLQSSIAERIKLRRKFKELGWNFTEFKAYATKHNWFVASMNSLGE